MDRRGRPHPKGLGVSSHRPEKTPNLWLRSGLRADAPIVMGIGESRARAHREKSNGGGDVDWAEKWRVPICFLLRGARDLLAMVYSLVDGTGGQAKREVSKWSFSFRAWGVRENRPNRPSCSRDVGISDT